MSRSGSVGFFRIFHGSLGFFRVFQEFLGFLGVLQGSSGFFKIVHGSLGFFRGLQGSLGIFSVPHGSSGFFSAVWIDISEDVNEFVMDSSPIQDALPPHSQCSRDRLRIHRSPERDKAPA